MEGCLTIYIASSWKNRHAVELLTEKLRFDGHVVLSFVENNFDEDQGASFEEWMRSDAAERSYEYDIHGATASDLVIYVGPSGTDAWAEVGAAFGSGVPIIGLWAKGEQSGLMRKMLVWFEDYRSLLNEVNSRYHSRLRRIDEQKARRAIEAEKVLA